MSKTIDTCNFAIGNLFVQQHGVHGLRRIVHVPRSLEEVEVLHLPRQQQVHQGGSNQSFGSGSGSTAEAKKLLLLFIAKFVGKSRKNLKKRKLAE